MSKSAETVVITRESGYHRFGQHYPAGSVLKLPADAAEHVLDSASPFGRKARAEEGKEAVDLTDAEPEMPAPAPADSRQPAKG
jgi:hypothetical protein